jgi:hypothetical protein
VRIFDKRQRAIVAWEKALIERLSEFLAGFGASPSDAEIVRKALREIEEPLQILVAGDDGPVRPAFVNALIGAGTHEEAEREANQIAVLRHAGETGERELANGVLQKSCQEEFLREVSVIDMPVAAIRNQEEVSLGFASSSDVIVLVASAGHPLSKAALYFLRSVRGWRKKVVIAAETADLSNANNERARRSLEESVGEALGAEPNVIFVSSAVARSDREQSGFVGLEAYLIEALDAESQVRLKMENSIGVVERLDIRYQFSIDERMSLLEGDLKNYENVENQLAFYVEAMNRDLASRMPDIESIFSRMNERGKDWLERNIRLLNATELAQAGKMRDRFQHEVVGDSDAVLNERVEELAEWMALRNLGQWNAVVEYVKSRQQAEYDESLVGEIGDNFEYDREEFIQSVGTTAMEAMRNYDEQLESGKITISLRDAVARTAAAEVGALGLGATTVAITTTVGLSITFALGTLLLATAGLLVIPNRRREAQENFTERTSALSERLCKTVQERFERELDLSVERMREAMSPYVRFI